MARTSSVVSDNSVASDSRRRQDKRDEAIRRRIDQEFSKKRRTPTKPKVPRRGTPGTVLALRPSEAATCKTNTNIYQAAQLMLAKRTNCVLVVDDMENLTGLVTAKDLALRVVGSGVDANSANIAQCMTPEPLTSLASTPASEALDRMLEHRFRHMPVVEDASHEIIGLLDVVKLYKKQMRKFDRLNSNSTRLFDSLEGLHSDLGVASSPPHIEEYLLSLRDQVNGPTIFSAVSSMPKPIYASLKATVYDVANMMRKNNTTVVLVRDGSGKLVGIVTSKDVTFRAIAAGLNPRICSVVRIMTPNPDVVMASATLRQALKQMLDGNYFNLPVQDESLSVVGVVTVLDLIHSTLQVVQENVENGFNNFWAAVDDELESGRSANDSGDLVSFLAEIKPSDSVSHAASPIRTRVQSMNRTLSTAGSESVCEVPPEVKMRSSTKISILQFEDNDAFITELARRAGCHRDHIVMSYRDDVGDKITIEDRTDLLLHINRNRARGIHQLEIWIETSSLAGGSTLGERWVIPLAVVIAATAVIAFTVQRKR